MPKLAHLRLLMALALLPALGATSAVAQRAANVRITDLADAPVGETVRVTVGARLLREARSMDLRLVTDTSLFQPLQAQGTEEGGMAVIYTGQQQDTLQYVLTHLDASASTTTLRTEPLLVVEGQRLREGAIPFRLVEAPVPIVSRSLTVQPADLGEGVSTERGVVPALPDEARLLGNHPNPFREETQVRFQARSSGRAQLAVYDALGRRVYRSSRAAYHAGYNTLPFPARGLASGVYYYRVQLSDGPSLRTGRMVIAQ